MPLDCETFFPETVGELLDGLDHIPSEKISFPYLSLYRRDFPVQRVYRDQAGENEMVFLVDGKPVFIEVKL